MIWSLSLPILRGKVGGEKTSTKQTKGKNIRNSNRRESPEIDTLKTTSNIS